MQSIKQKTNNELCHHGIKGQKWGKRNGPPYPLTGEGKKASIAQKKAASGRGGSGPTSDYAGHKKKSKMTQDAAGQVTKVSRSGKYGDSDSFTQETSTSQQSQSQEQQKTYRPQYPGTKLQNDKSTMTDEELRAYKDKNIREGNIKEIQKNRNIYSDDEIRAAINRNSLNRELDSITAKDVKTGVDKVNSLINGISKATDLAETGIRAYNVVAKVANSLGEDLPVLDGNRRRGNIADGKDLKQLSEIINNPSKYSTEDIKNANSAYKELAEAKDRVRGRDNQNVTVRDIVTNGAKNYTEAEMKNAVARQQALENVIAASAKRQEEAEKYANERLEILNAAKK